MNARIVLTRRLAAIASYLAARDRVDQALDRQTRVDSSPIAGSAAVPFYLDRTDRAASRPDFRS